MSSAVVTPIIQPDAAVMAEHLNHLFGGFLDGFQDGLIELRAITKDGPVRFHYFGTDDIDGMVAKAVELNKLHMTNIYFGAALRHPSTFPGGAGDDEDAYALPCAYVDLDDPGAADKAKDLYGDNKPTFVTVTGRHPHTRAQLWWRLDEPMTDHAQWTAMLRGIAQNLGGDLTVCNPSRIMRLAGSIAWPVKPGRMIEPTLHVPLKTPGLPAYQPTHLASAFPVKEGVIGDGSINHLGTAVVHTTNGLGLQDRVADGRETYMRNLTMAALASFIRENGTAPSPQELFDEAWPTYERNVDFSRPGRGVDEFKRKCVYTVARFNRGHIPGMRTLDEAVATVKSVPPGAVATASGAGGVADPPAPTGPLVLSAAEFIAGFTPPEYLIDGMIQRGYLYSLTARTGHGKTAVSMYLGQAIARGAKIQNRGVKQGSVLFLAGENPDDIRARFIVLAEQWGFDPSDIPFHFIAGVVDIAACLPRIREECAKIDNLQLVIVDTAAAYFKGDDGNSNVQQGAFARVLRQLSFLPGKPCVLVPCHPVKNASRENLLPVGGGAFLNEVDGNLTLWSGAENQTTLHWQGKFRGPEFEPTTFKMETATSPKVADSQGRAIPSVIAKPMGEVEIEMGEKATESDEDMLLAAIHRNRRSSYATLAQLCGWVGKDGQPQKSKTYRVGERLVAHKLAYYDRAKLAITKKGKKAIGVKDDEDDD